jgi:hypothetical protein
MPRLAATVKIQAADIWKKQLLEVKQNATNGFTDLKKIKGYYDVVIASKQYKKVAKSINTFQHQLEADEVMKAQDKYH